jgi:hypothetical protein
MLIGELQSLELITSSAAEIHYDIACTDWDGTGVTPNSFSGIISGAGTNEIVPVFAGKRSIHRLTVRNADTSITCICQIQKDVNGTKIKISKSASSDPGELVMEYEAQYGWKEQADVTVNVSGGGGGGGTAWTDVTVTDADFTAVDDERYYLPAGVLSANRNVDMSGVTTRVMFVVAEDADVFGLVMTGATVYRQGGNSTFVYINGQQATTIEKVGSKLIQTA